MKRFTLAGLLLVLLMSPAAAGVIDDAHKSGVLRIGVSDFVPWVMPGKNGDLIGFEIDVGRKVAADFGVKPEFVEVNWGRIIDDLENNQFDVIISGMSITPDRGERVDFTAPYSRSRLGMVGSRELADGFSVADFNDAGVTLSCRSGATPCAMADDMFPRSTLLDFGTEEEMFAVVEEGRVHAALSASPAPSLRVLDNPGKLFTVTLPPSDALSEEAFALRKGDLQALGAFSAWIRENRDWISRRHNYWFMTREWESLLP